MARAMAESLASRNKARQSAQSLRAFDVARVSLEVEGMTELEMLGREKPACPHGPPWTYDPNVKKPEAERPRWFYYQAIKTKTKTPRYLQPRVCKRCGKGFIVDIETGEATPTEFDADGMLVLEVSHDTGTIQRVEL